jgi:GrpB-like predicted nucleotidyltransferase (UPF0157 family)
MLIVAYQSDWAKQFEQIKEKLNLAVQGLSVRIEHIGSTAVEGLAAKPIIDIDLIYTQNDDFEPVKANLARIGYQHGGDQGIEGREVFKRIAQEQDAVLDKIPHHLYVGKFDSTEIQRHLLFRDYLRKHAEARHFYMNLKYEIAQEAQQDRKIYAQIKEIKARSFINYLIELAKLDH